MRIAAGTDASIAAIMEAEAKRIGAAADRAVDQAAIALRDEVRAQTRSAGLGPNLERTWTYKRYPASGRQEAMALVYTKAPRIIDAHSADTIISARNAQWLVIPLPAAKEAGLDRSLGRGDADRGGRWRATQAKWSNVEAATERFGGLSFVPLPNNQAMLVARERSGKPVPLFLLLKRVSLRKRLDVGSPVARAGDRLREAFLSDLGAS